MTRATTCQSIGRCRPCLRRSVSLIMPRRFASDRADNLTRSTPVVVGLDAREIVAGEHLLALIGRALRSPPNPDRWRVGLRGFDDDGAGPEAKYRPLVRALRRHALTAPRQPRSDGTRADRASPARRRRMARANASIVAPATAHLETLTTRRPWAARHARGTASGDIDPVIGSPVEGNGCPCAEQITIRPGRRRIRRTATTTSPRRRKSGPWGRSTPSLPAVISNSAANAATMGYPVSLRTSTNTRYVLIAQASPTTTASEISRSPPMACATALIAYCSIEAWSKKSRTGQSPASHCLASVRCRKLSLVADVIRSACHATASTASRYRAGSRRRRHASIAAVRGHTRPVLTQVACLVAFRSSCTAQSASVLR